MDHTIQSLLPSCLCAADRVGNSRRVADIHGFIADISGLLQFTIGFEPRPNVLG